MGLSLKFPEKRYRKLVDMENIQCKKRSFFNDNAKLGAWRASLNDLYHTLKKFI